MYVSVTVLYVSSVQHLQIASLPGIGLCGFCGREVKASVRVCEQIYLNKIDYSRVALRVVEPLKCGGRLGGCVLLINRVRHPKRIPTTLQWLRSAAIQFISCTFRSFAMHKWLSSHNVPTIICSLCFETTSEYLQLVLTDAFQVCQSCALTLIASQNFQFICMLSSR